MAGVIALAYWLDLPPLRRQGRDRMEWKAHRTCLFYCRNCRGQFTVLTGSVMERSHLPLPKWVLAIRLMNSRKQGVSAHQLHRSLVLTYKDCMVHGAGHPRGSARGKSNPARRRRQDRG